MNPSLNLNLACQFLRNECFGYSLKEIDAFSLKVADVAALPTL